MADDYEKASHGEGIFSHFYHRYFEGYSEYMIIEPDGKRRIERVYTGEYYICPLTGMKKAARGAAYVFAFTLSAFLFVWAASRPVEANSAMYVVAATAIAIAGYVMVGRGIFNYCTNPTKMTVGEWRSATERIINGSTFCSAFGILTGIMAMINNLQHGDCGAMYYIAAYAMAAGILLFLRKTEKDTRYETSASQATCPKYATHIS